MQSRLRSLTIVPVARLAPALALLPALALAIGCTTRAPGEVATTIYTGGTIITVNDAQPTAGAIAVKDGRILAIGDRDDVLKFKGDATAVVTASAQTFTGKRTHSISSQDIGPQDHRRPLRSRRASRE